MGRQIISAILSSQPPRVSSLQPVTPPALDRLVTRCLEKDPDDRAESARDVAEELRGILADADSSRVSARLPQPRSVLRLVVASTAVVIIAVAAIAGAGWLPFWFRAPEPRPEVMPLTTLSGDEICSSLSPDGNQVAFTWEGEKRDNVDIYVMFVGSAVVRRLTTDPRRNTARAGRRMGGRLRDMRRTSPTPVPGTFVIHLMSALGGSDLKLSDVTVWGPLDWSPDGKYIAAARAPGAAEGRTGIYLFPVSGGEPRPITVGTSSVFDRAASFSPDGRRLAYASCTAIFHRNCDMLSIDLNRTFAPTGPARRLTRHASFETSSIAWTRDGRYVIYR